MLFVEMVRDHADKPLPREDEEATWGDDTVHRLNEAYGFSGAQVGAAKSLAYRVIRDGYDAFLDKAREQVPGRMIQVSNHWPHA